QLPINDANDGRLIPADGGAKRRCGRYFHKVNSPSLQQRHDLVSAVGRGVACYHGENQRVSPRRFTYLFDSYHCPTTAHAESQQTENPRGDLGIRGHVAPFPSPPVPPASSARDSWSALASSVVSSSMSAMMRSASSGAMPGSLRKSSRSRSMMS